MFVRGALVAGRGDFGAPEESVGRSAKVDRALARGVGAGARWIGVAGSRHAALPRHGAWRVDLVDARHGRGRIAAGRQLRADPRRGVHPAPPRRRPRAGRRDRRLTPEPLRHERDRASLRRPGDGPPSVAIGRASHTRAAPRGGAGRHTHASPVRGPRGPRRSNRTGGPRPMPSVSMRQLLEAGVHFGHQTRRWNPKMKPYIFAERNGIHIIDLAQTVKRLDDALDVRHRHRRRWRLRSCSWAPRSRPRSPSPRRPAAPRCPMSTSAGWAACSPTS